MYPHSCCFDLWHRREAADYRAESRWFRKLEKEGLDPHEMTPKRTIYADAFRRLRIDHLHHPIQLGPCPKRKGQNQHSFPRVASVGAGAECGLALDDIVLAVNGKDVRKDKSVRALLSGGSELQLVVDILRDE